MALEDIGRGQQVDEQHHLRAALDEPTTGLLGGVGKRVFDIIFALSAIVPLSGTMIVIAAILWIRSGGGPVFYQQQRVGKGGKPFGCLKFRTMVIDADARLKDILKSDPDAAAEFMASHKLRNDPRIIPGIGTFLRKTSLDELPQFFNVLFGDMSVVGARPVTSEEFHRHYGWNHPYVSARPGITGPWQTSGRNDVSFEERVRMDAKYIRNRTFLQDIKIIARTVSIVFLHRNGH